MNQHKTQAQQIATHLRRKAMTHMDMLALGVSVCPWRRLADSPSYLRPGEQLVKGKDGEGRVTYRIRKTA
jgi:hypothetical protein